MTINGKDGGLPARPKTAPEKAVVQAAPQAAQAPQAAVAVAGGEARSIVRAAKRDQRVAYERVLADARRAGKAYYWAWTVKTRDGGRQLVKGPSVWCTLACARLWGALDVQTAVESEDLETWTIRATALDLESGFSTSTLFRQRKRVGGLEALGEGRALDAAFQIGQSKALRNALARVLPRWLLDEAVAAAWEGERNRAAGGSEEAVVAPGTLANPRARQAVLAALAAHGVTPQQVEARVGHSLDTLTVDEVADLGAIATALDEGQTSVFNEFGGETAARPDVAEALAREHAAREAEVVTAPPAAAPAPQPERPAPAQRAKAPKAGPTAPTQKAESAPAAAPAPAAGAANEAPRPNPMRQRALNLARALGIAETTVEQVARGLGLDLDNLDAAGFAKLADTLSR